MTFEFVKFCENFYYSRDILAKVYLINLHPPLKGGQPFPPFKPSLNKGDPPLFMGGWVTGLTNPPLKNVVTSTLKKGGLFKGG